MAIPYRVEENSLEETKILNSIELLKNLTDKVDESVSFTRFFECLHEKDDIYLIIKNYGDEV